jgi:hypothetical protein
MPFPPEHVDDGGEIVVRDTMLRVLAGGDHYEVLGCLPLPKPDATSADNLRRWILLQSLPHTAIQSAYRFVCFC